MPSRVACYVAAGAAAYATSTAFTSIAGPRSLRAAPAATTADLRGAPERQHGSLAPTAVLAVGTFAAAGLAAQAGKRGARRSVKTCALGTIDPAALKEVEKAKADYEMKKWAAEKLAAEGAPQAAMVAQNAAAAEAKWRAMEEQAAASAGAPAPYKPPVSTPVAPAPAQQYSPPAPDLLALKKEAEKAKADFDMKKWAAEKLASEGAPQAAMVAQNAAAAEAKWAALDQQLKAAEGDFGWKAPAAFSAGAAPAAAPAAFAPAAAIKTLPDTANAELKKAKEQADLLTWAYQKLASEGAPQAATMKTKADQAVAAYNALLNA